MQRLDAFVARDTVLIFISRSLERVVDHATNVAEMVIDLVESKMVRHMLAQPPPD